ncbi:MAG: S1C family serine protease [Pyrinomonadaceae bacterium]
MNTNNEQSGHNLSDFSAQITKAVETAAKSIAAVDARPRVATSGVLWREGVIVSTNHTIARDEEITVTLADGRTAKATLVGRDAGTDLAVLKIDDEEIAKSLKPADISETSEIKVGNIVLAVGRTGKDATASFGVVAQTGGAWQTWRSDEIERFISLDLAIYLGFSGGALIDANGKVLGVNTSAFGRGLALTIPSETVTRVVDILLTKGRIAKPYLGIGTQAVPLSESLRERLNLEQPSGLMMLTVETDGAAEKAGVLIGDVLLAIDEKTTLEPSDVQAALRGKEAGNAVKAKLLRGGELREIEIVLGERPARESEARRRGRGGRGWRRRGC